MTLLSFPVEQTAIDAGKLLTWTKGFEAKNAVGQDIVRLLQDSLDRKHIHVRCSALVNDVRKCPLFKVTAPDHGLDCWDTFVAFISAWSSSDWGNIRYRNERRIYRQNTDDQEAGSGTDRLGGEKRRSRRGVYGDQYGMGSSG